MSFLIRDMRFRPVFVLIWCTAYLFIRQFILYVWFSLAVCGFSSTLETYTPSRRVYLSFVLYFLRGFPENANRSQSPTRRE